jgi:hypothetical protein
MGGVKSCLLIGDWRMIDLIDLPKEQISRSSAQCTAGLQLAMGARRSKGYPSPEAIRRYI